MFDLDQAISAWRRQMAAGGLRTPDVLNELESHLRDDVADQMSAGGDAAQAFAAAVQRLGEAGVLRPEFEKAQATLARRLQSISVAVGGLLYLTCGSIGLVKQDLSPSERLLGGAALACAVLLALGARRLGR